MIAATGRSCPASRQANPAPTSAPTPSNPAMVVGACASAMKSSRATTSRAMASSVTSPLSACGVPIHVRDQILLVRVDARVAEDLLSGAVIEGRGREGLRGTAEVLRDLQVRVAVGGVGERQLGEKLLGGAVGVVRVDAEERDLPAALGGERLEPGEFEAAGTAPRRPLVDHDRDPVKLREPGIEGVLAPVEQLIALCADLGEL